LPGFPASSRIWEATAPQEARPAPREAVTGTTPPEAVLKGVIAEDLTGLAARRAAYIASDEDQNTSTQAGQEAHDEVNTLFLEVRGLRVDLQLAADQAFPYTEKLNAPTRRAFKIPADRPAVE